MRNSTQTSGSKNTREGEGTFTLLSRQHRGAGRGRPGTLSSLLTLSQGRQLSAFTRQRQLRQCLQVCHQVRHLLERTGDRTRARSLREQQLVGCSQKHSALGCIRGRGASAACKPQGLLSAEGTRGLLAVEVFWGPPAFQDPSHLLAV